MTLWCALPGRPGDPKSRPLEVPDMTCDVNITSGDVLQERIDFEVPGVMPVTISRLYSSAQTPVSSALGFGWAHSLEIWVDLGADGIAIREGYNGSTPYPWGACDGQNGPRVERGDRRVSLRFADGSVRHFVAATAGATRFHLAADIDAYGNATRFEYDDRHLRRVTTSEGRIVELHYASAGFLELVTLADEGLTAEPIVVTRYKVDANGDLVAVTDSRGFSELYGYADHLLVAHQNRVGGRTYYAYDASRRCCCAWQHDGKRIRCLEYDSVRAYTLVTDSFGAVTLQRLNEAGLIVEQIDPLGNVNQLTYDGAGGFVAMFDEIGLVGETSTYEAALA